MCHWDIMSFFYYPKGSLYFFFPLMMFYRNIDWRAGQFTQHFYRRMERKHRYIPCLDIILSKLTRNRKELDFVASRYYRINQILLSIVQIWPYEKSMSTSIIRTFLFSILFSEVFFQVSFILYDNKSFVVTYCAKYHAIQVN